MQLDMGKGGGGHYHIKAAAALLCVCLLRILAMVVPGPLLELQLHKCSSPCT